MSQRIQKGPDRVSEVSGDGESTAKETKKKERLKRQEMEKRRVFVDKRVETNKRSVRGVSSRWRRRISGRRRGEGASLPCYP